MARQTNRKQTKKAGAGKKTGKPEEANDLVSQLAAAPTTLMKVFGEEMDRLGLSREWLKSMKNEFDPGIWTPQVEMFEREGELVVRADLPGLTKDDVNVELGDGGITIAGERRTEKEEKREGFYHSERRYGKFYRRLPLPEGTNVADASATFRDGVLEVTMEAPKRMDSKPRRLSIREESPAQARSKAA